jgi:hypothetical protein
MTSTHTLIRHNDETAGGVAGPLTWLSPEAKLWVASRDGDFAGFVEFTDGHYDVTDARGAHVASCGTLHQAQDAVELSVRRASTLTTLAYVAVGAGAVAVSAFAVGLGLINLG